MRLKDSFNKYFEECGLHRQWFAKKLGIVPHSFYQMVAGNIPIPKSKWRDVIRLSGGAISLADILSYYLDDWDLTIVEYKNRQPLKCIVKMKGEPEEDDVDDDKN